jgi:hypothetical protein
MPLSRLENFLRSVRGNIIYVDPNSLDSTDSIENDGTSAARPFKTLQRALIEASRFSYLPGKDNDKFANTTILLYPGEHLIDNRPGWIPITGSTFLLRNGTSSTDFSEFNLQTNFDINSDNNALYKFNSIHGGVIIPRGTSIVGYDLRKTKIRPKYVPNPENDNIERSAIFRLTGGCYIWQMSIFDATPNGQCFKDYTTNKFVPNFSHHKLTAFEYVDGINGVTINDAFIGNFPSSVTPAYSTTRTDLDIYYEKIGLAYGNSSGRRILPNYPEEIDIESKIDEYRIVGSRGVEVGISSLRSGDGITPTSEITVSLQESLSGVDVDTPIRISGVSESGYNGQYVVSKVLSDTEISYNVTTPPTIPISLFQGTLSIVVDTVTSASPYIFNCSLRSVYGLCGLNADGSVVTGFKSIVVAQFTGISLQKDNNAFIKYDETTDTYIDKTNVINIYSDSLARYKPSYENYHIKASNDAFIQAVSVFAIGYASHFLAESGGDMSITNSNSNFGAKSLVSVGFRNDKFIRDDVGYISHIIPPKQINKKNTSIEFYPIDAELTRNVANSSRLYLYDADTPNSPPISVLDGYRIGSKKDDKIYLSAYINNAEVEYSASILMQGNDGNTYQKEYGVKKQANVNLISNNVIQLAADHDLYTGETVRIYSESGQLPNSLDSNTIYYAITNQTDFSLLASQIRLAASFNDAQNSIGIVIYNTSSANLKIISRVSDKNSGDFGHPIQYDDINGRWYINTNPGNDLYSFIASSTISITSRSYIKRILDERKSSDSIYKFRCVIPKDGTLKGRPPINGFVLQESSAIPASPSEINLEYSSDGLTKQLLNSQQIRNNRFIAKASYSGGIATIKTEREHNLNVGNLVEILNVISQNNLNAEPNKGFNGVYRVLEIKSRREFTYSLSLNPGIFIDNTSNRSITLPYYNRKNLNGTYVAYESEVVQDYVQNKQDGIYYIKFLNSANSPQLPPFENYRFSQSIQNLYPQKDRDNLVSDPLPSKSFAVSDPIGKVVVNNPEKSITRETLESFITDIAVGFAVTNITSNTTGIAHTFFTDIEHGLNPITSLTLATGGFGYGSNIGNETLYNAELVGGTGEGASALVRINSSGVVQSLELMNGGTSYTVGDTLTIVGIATTTGHIPSTVTVSSIYNHAGEVFNLYGNLSDEYSHYNSLYRIVSVDNSRKITCTSAEEILPALPNSSSVITEKLYANLTGRSLSVSSLTYNSNVGIGTVVVSNAHGLRVNDKFRLFGATEDIFNDEFLVSKVNSLTSFDFYVGISTVQSTAGTITLYPYGISSKGGDNAKGIEDRILTQYHGRTTVTTSPMNNVDTSVSLQNLSSLGLKIGDYIRIDNEIMRIRDTVTTNPIKVFRGLFGTFGSQHVNGSVVTKVHPYPIEFRRHSILRASGHTFEYVGFGPGNYSNAFPDRQDRQISNDEELLSQSFKVDGGINVYTGMNNDGDFYIGNKIINSSTGEETVFEYPVPLIRGQDDYNNETFINFTQTDKINVKDSLIVDGGKNNDSISEFNGPVIFNNKVLSNSIRGIEAKSLYLQGDESISRKYTIGISTPFVSGTPGDVQYNSLPEDEGTIGWVYTKSNAWRRFGIIESPLGFQFLKANKPDRKTFGTLTFNDNIILAFGSDDDAEFYYDGIDLKLDLNIGIGSFSITDGIDTRFTFEKDGTLNAGFFERWIFCWCWFRINRR